MCYDLRRVLENGYWSSGCVGSLRYTLPNHRRLRIRTGVASLLNETQVRHPFLVQLRYSFQTSKRLFLITDLYEGGSLEDALDAARRFPKTTHTGSFFFWSLKEEKKVARLVLISCVNQGEVWSAGSHFPARKSGLGLDGARFIAR